MHILLLDFKIAEQDISTEVAFIYLRSRLTLTLQ